jgi:hypothetical protein
VEKGSKLNLKDPLKIVGSYGMTVIFYRNSFKFNLLISKPSISIIPYSSSRILDRVNAIVDFPAPVLPTIPIFYYGKISNERFDNTIGVLGLYLSETFLNSIFALIGQFKGTESPSYFS